MNDKQDAWKDKKCSGYNSFVEKYTGLKLLMKYNRRQQDEIQVDMK
jgi:hypothetical protein